MLSRRGQPPLTAELLVGIVLGPTILGRFLPSVHALFFPDDLLQESMLETVSWLGVLFLLLSTGMEIDFSIAWGQRGPALVIALTDIVVPMAVAFVPAVLIPSRYLVEPSQRIIFASFMATAMTISAMPVAARVLHDVDVFRADLGLLIMSALAVNDLLGWVIFTIVLGLFTQAAHGAGPVLAVFFGTLGVSVIALTWGRSLSTRTLTLLQRRGFPEPATSLTFACLLGFLLGAVTQGLGIHALFGFFVAGIVIGESRALSQETRVTIEQMVHAVFVPLFFASIGLRMDFIRSFDAPLALFVTVVGIAGRYAGAALGARMANIPRRDRTIVAIAHTPGGMMEIVVALLAYDAGLITARVFTAIAFGAVFSSIIVGPWLKGALDRRPMVCVADYMRPGSAIAALSHPTKEGVLEELVSRAGAHLPSRIRAAMLSALTSREAEFSTAIEHGLAIPHLRIDGISQPLVLFGRSEHGVEWDAPDGQPTHHVFLVVSPIGRNDVHLELLANIARAMRNPRTREAIDAARDDATLLATLRTCFCAPAGRPTPSQAS